MTTYQIVCKNLSSNNSRIEKVGLVNEGQPTNRATKIITPNEANGLLEQGDKCFFVNEDGDKVYVSTFGDNFIKTNPDGIKHNNLRELRDCRIE